MARPLGWRCVVIGLGAGVDPKTIPQGAAGTVLAVVAANDEPVFTASPTLTDLTVGSLTIASNQAGALVILPFGTSAGETGEIRLRELAANGTNRVSVKAPDALAGNWTLTVPSAAPTVNNQVLTGQTTGVASWTTPAAIPTVRAPMQFWSTGQVAAGATVYLGNGHSTIQDVQFQVPFACTILTMYSVAPDNNVGVGQTWVYTVRVSASDTAITHTVTGANNVGTSSGSVAAAAGAQVDIKLVTSGGAALSTHQITLALQPT